MLRASRPWLVIALLMLVLTASAPLVLAQGGPITVSVFPSLAPNVFGSSSFTPWESNTISALQSGSSTAGNPALPSYYQQIPNGALIPIWIASEFPSWHNQANPGTVFGAAFAGELGNRLYFNLHIVGNGLQFSISQLSLQATSTDPGNFLGLSVPAGSYNYNSGYVGLDYVDGIKGNGNDVLITGGANTQLIDELFARGSGNAPAVSNSDPGATDQEKIDNMISTLPSAFIFSGTYSLSTNGDPVTGNAFVVVSIPEPTTVVLTGLGGTALACLCLSQWKKRRRHKFRKHSVVAS